MTRRLVVMGILASVVVGCSNEPGREATTSETAAAPVPALGIVEHVGTERTEVQTSGTGGGPVLDEAPLGVVVRLKAASTFEHRTRLRATRTRAADVSASARSHRRALSEHHGRLLRGLAAKLGKAVVPRGRNRALGAIQYEDFHDALNAVALHGVSEQSVRDALRDDPEVIAVERIVRVQASLLESVPLVDAEEVWAVVDAGGVPVDGTGIRIGIIDTGVDYTHPDLGGCLGPGCKVAGGYDFVNRDGDPRDDNGHGTHVAAIAAGDGTYAGPFGSAPIRGVAPRARLFAYKALAADGRGISTDTIAAIQRCADPDGDGDPSDHLDVCNLSFGAFGTPDDAISTAVDNAVSAGVVMAVAAGNSGPAVSTIDSPGTARRAITVASSCKPASVGADSRCTQPIASTSSRGPVVWTGANGIQQTLAKPDIAAPGVNVCAAEWGTFQSGLRCLDGQHVSLAGTSMATPHVAGAAALLRQAHPAWTPDQVKTYLMAAAESLGLDPSLQGAGRLDVLGSVVLDGGIVGSVGRVEGAPLLDRDDPTSRLATFTSSVSVTNTTAQPLSYVATFSAADAGLTAFIDPPELTLAPGQTGALVVTRLVDHDIARSGAEVRGTVVLSTVLGEVRVPLAIGVRDRVIASPATVDLGVDLASQPSWTGQQTIQLANTIGDAAVTYSASITCCSAVDDPTPSGLSATVDRSSVTMPAGGAASITVTVNAQNASLRTTHYRGTLHLTSPRQTLEIPVSFFKGYGLELHFGSEVPSAVAISSASLGSSTTAPGATAALYYLTQPGPYFVEATWPGTGPYRSYHVLAANLASDVPVCVATLDKSQAIHTLELRPVGPNGAAPTDATFQYRFTHGASGGGVRFQGSQRDTTQGMKLRVSTVPPAFNFTAPMLAKAGSDLLLYLYEIPEGIAGDLTVTNTPAELIANDVRGFRPGSGESVPYLVPRACLTGSYQSVAMSFMPTSFTCYSWPPVLSTALAPATTARLYFYNRAARDLLAAPFPDAPWIDFELHAGSPTGQFLYRGPHVYAKPDGVFAWESGARYYATADTIYDTMGCELAPAGSILPLGNGPLVPAWRWTNYASNVQYQAQRASSASPYQWSGCFQEGHDLATDTSYRLYRDGALIASGPLTRYTQVYFPGTGSHRLELTRTAVIAGVTTQVQTVSTFATSVAFPLLDENPPALRSLHVVSRGAWQEVLDPTASSRLAFDVDPGPGISGYDNGPVLMPDALAAVTLEQSADGASWTEVALTATSTVYQSAMLDVDPAAPLTWFRITATDVAGNHLVHRFQIPTGVGYGASGPDVSAPIASLTAPADGAIVSGTVQLTATASDDVGVARVEFSLDGATILGTATTAPYAIFWDTASATSGAHTLTARAFDLAGNAGVSTVVRVTVDNAAPTVTLAQPAAGAVISGTVQLSATASDDVGVTRVEFLSDAKLVGTATAAPYTVAWESAAVANGSHILTAVAHDAAGHSSVSAAVTVTVAANAGVLTAVYDPARRAPACATVAAGCDTAALVNGRSNRLGPEPNYSNTLGASCTDGTSGTYHSDESIDRVRVVTVDGGPFAAGKTVRVEVTVWAWSTADRLDVYYTRSADAPSWTLAGTVAPTARGAQTLVVTYTLPAGPLQAVRANFRYSSTPGPCTPGAYDDRDDVAFSVQ